MQYIVAISWILAFARMTNSENYMNTVALKDGFTTANPYESSSGGRGIGKSNFFIDMRLFLCYRFIFTKESVIWKVMYLSEF